MKRPFKTQLIVKLMLLLCAGSVEMLLGQSNTETQSGPEKAHAEIAKLRAETDKLQAEATYYRRAPLLNLTPTAIGLMAIAIPVVIALKQLGAQKTAQQERARVDASLKAAEIAMNAQSTDQMRSRAEVLSRLLSELVPDFGQSLKVLDHGKFGFYSWRTRFSSLLEAIASHPSDALLLVRIYDTLFPEDNANSGGRIGELIEQLQAKA